MTCTGFTKMSRFISSVLFLVCICICLGRSCLIQTRPQRATANVPHYQLAAAMQPPATINLHSIYIQAAIEKLQTCLTHSLSDRLAGYEEYLPVTGVCENQLPHLSEFILLTQAHTHAISKKADVMTHIAKTLHCHQYQLLSLIFFLF